MTLQQKVNDLAKAYPLPPNDKMERRLNRIERMTDFYNEKIEIAPERQALLFKGFVSALMYASTIIHMHRKLTKRLADMADEDKNEA